MKMLTDYPKVAEDITRWLEGWLKRDFELPQVGTGTVVDLTSRRAIPESISLGALAREET